MRDLLNVYPYPNFPVILEDQLRGLLSRGEIEESILSGEPPEIHPAGICYPDQTIQVIGNAFLESMVPVLIVVDLDDGSVRGIITLHDLIWARAAVQQ